METIQLAIRAMEPFGAEITGVDLSREVPEACKQQLRDAWRTHALLYFPDQQLTKEEHLRATGIFGNISDQGVPEAPVPGGVNFITNLYERGIGPDGEMNLHVPGELRFHLDNTFHDALLKGISLYAIEVPAPGQGGDTLFSDIRHAYRLLPNVLRERIVHLSALYKVPVKPGFPESEQSAVHSLVHQHPDTGETLLFLSRRHADHILELSASEGETLMDELSTYIERPEIIYRHQWKAKDLVLWDNLAIQHARDAFDPAARRHLRRTQIG